MDPRFFADPDAFRAWLEGHHQDATELIIGYWKKATGRPSVTWEETVDEALCVGWIDGVRRRLDDESFTVRFTPRRDGSVWSRRNLDRVDALRAEGRMRPAGIAAWEARRPDRSGYSVSDRVEDFPPEVQERFGDAWAFHAQQPPGYRAQVADWVLAAKQDATKERRLAAVIAAARKGVRVEMARPFAHLDE